MSENKDMNIVEEDAAAIPEEGDTEAAPRQTPASVQPQPANTPNPQKIITGLQQSGLHPDLINYRSDLYVGTNAFANEIAAFKASAVCKTGYSNMDAVQPLYPGFYVIGAVPSLGKTTFMHQIADQIASAGTPVIYISLEQNSLELYSKAIARRMFKHSLEDDTYTTYSSIQIRRGDADSTREFNEQTAAYVKDTGYNMTVVPNFEITVENIAYYVDNFIEVMNRKPVVIIDYLQIIKPTTFKTSTYSFRTVEGKESIDHIVHSLKGIQSKYNIPLIAISSLNRNGYIVPITYESFKESGGIEYTADVIWGLQLRVITSPEFENEKTITGKHKMADTAKAATPREIEFVCLKNRYGRSSYNMYFDYYPAYDTFIPTTNYADATNARASITSQSASAQQTASTPSSSSPVSSNAGMSAFFDLRDNPAPVSSAKHDKWSAYPEDFAKRMKLSERASRKYNRLTPEQKQQNYAIGTDVITISDICTVNRDDYGPDTTEDISPEEERCIRNPEYCNAVKEFYADHGITCWAPDPMMYNRTHYYKVNKDGSRGELIKTVDDPAYSSDVQHYRDLFDKAMDRLSLTPVKTNAAPSDDQKAVESLTRIANQAAAEDTAIEEKFKRLTDKQLSAVYSIEGETILLADDKPDIDTSGMHQPVTERISAEEDRITPDTAYAEAVKKYYADRGISLWAPQENEYPCTVRYATDASGHRKGRTGIEYDDPYTARLNTYYRLRREVIKTIKI